MARFSLSRACGRSVAPVPAREHQISSVGTARKRSLSRNVVVAPRVQEEDASSHAVESVQPPETKLPPNESGAPSPSAIRRYRLNDPHSQSTPLAARAASAEVFRVESPLASESSSGSQS